MSDPALIKSAAVHPLDTAVILAQGGVFDEPVVPMSGGPDRPGPLTVIEGLPLFVRTVLTLQRAGITHLIVIAGEEESALKRALAEDRRVSALVRWMPMREFPTQELRTWEALASEVHGPCLVLGGQAVFSRALIEHLRREAAEGQSVLVVTHPADMPTRPPVAADLLVLPRGFLAGLAERSQAVTASEGSPLRAMTNQALADGRLHTVATSGNAAFWYQNVRHAGDPERAAYSLVRSLKGEHEGLVDTYFNRKISAVLTRAFLIAGWSPNAITAVSILVGLAAAGFFAYGTYGAGVTGALLFQLAAIIDCCDGEVARLTFQESRFGEQLDLLGDNAVHMAIFAGIAWAGFRQAGSVVPLLLGAAAILGNLLSLWFVARVKARHEQQGWTNPAQASRTAFILKHIASRDFSIVVLFFALVDGLGWFLWLAALGSNVFWAYVAWVSRVPTARA